MFGNREPEYRDREYFWCNTSTKVTEIRIKLKDQKADIMLKNLPYPQTTRLNVTRNPQNGDLQLDYLKNGKQLAQEIISGHIISRVSIVFE